MFYQRHIFFCTQERDDGHCCAAHGARELSGHARQRAKDLGIHDAGAVRVNHAGCLGRCGEGPVAVVYPDNVWYTYAERKDIDEIVEEHLVHGRVVKRLQI